MKTFYITESIIFFILGILFALYFPKDTDRTSGTPVITSKTYLTGEFIEGGHFCLQTLTVIPDKFKATKKMECDK